MGPIDINIIKLGAGLLLLILANIALGSVRAVIERTFDKTKLINGMMKGGIISAVLIAVYLSGWLNPDLLVIDADGESINLMTAIYLLLLAAFAFYAIDILKKLKQILTSHVPDASSYLTEEDTTDEEDAQEEEDHE